MKRLWSIIDGLKLNKKVKSGIYLAAKILIDVMLGAIVWLLLKDFLKPGIGTLVCFTGYPAIILGLFGGTFYLYDHEFA